MIICIANHWFLWTRCWTFQRAVRRSGRTERLKKNMRLCSQGCTKTRLMLQKLTLISITYWYHATLSNSGLRHQPHILYNGFSELLRPFFIICDYMRFWYRIWYNFWSQKRILKPFSALTRNPVTIDVHSGGNWTVVQLLLNVTGTLMGHQHNGRISVPEVMGVANPQANFLADPSWQGLDLALGVRPLAVLLIEAH